MDTLKSLIYSSVRGPNESDIRRVGHGAIGLDDNDDDDVDVDVDIDIEDDCDDKKTSTRMPNNKFSIETLLRQRGATSSSSSTETSPTADTVDAKTAAMSAAISALMVRTIFLRHCSHQYLMGSIT